MTGERKAPRFLSPEEKLAIRRGQPTGTPAIDAIIDRMNGRHHPNSLSASLPSDDPSGLIQAEKERQEVARRSFAVAQGAKLSEQQRFNDIVAAKYRDLGLLTRHVQARLIALSIPPDIDLAIPKKGIFGKEKFFGPGWVISETASYEYTPSIGDGRYTPPQTMWAHGKAMLFDGRVASYKDNSPKGFLDLDNPSTFFDASRPFEDYVGSVSFIQHPFSDPRPHLSKELGVTELTIKDAAVYEDLSSRLQQMARFAIDRGIE